MNALGPLFEPLPSAVQSSRTSLAAADAIRGETGRLRRKVLEALAALGTRGATDEELQEAIPMAPSTERPRRIELCRAGLVRDSGATRRTRSGRRATVWVAAEVAP